MSGASLEQTLSRYWGFEQFRSIQKEAIEAILNGQDVISLLATGGGKSIIYQLPALHSGGKALIISPLISLMEDQVNRLAALNIGARAIHSNMDQARIRNAIDDFKYGEVSFLYLAPERATQAVFVEGMSGTRIDYVAIDEAHCISQWGHDFRPSYLQLRMLRELSRTASIIALTATASPLVLEDIRAVLQLRKPRLFQDSFYRKNLIINTVNVANKYTQLVKDLKNIQTGSSIVFRRSRAGVEELSKYLEEVGIKSSCYHAGMSAEKRGAAQKKWLEGHTPVIVATNAFGMGIDKADVRSVIHFDLPNTPEEYFQEIGRAGRDGNNSLCWLYYDASSIEQKHNLVKNSKPDYKASRRLYGQVCSFLGIAQGAWPEYHLGFDLERFCRSQKIDRFEFYRDFKLLERDQYLRLSEKEGSDRIGIRFSNADEDSEYNHIIDSFRRLSNEVFYEMQYFDLGTLAYKLNMEKLELRSHLATMASQGLITLDDHDLPFSILFLKERQNSKLLSFNHVSWNQQYKLRVERFEQLRKMIEGDQCRYQFLLSYFGESIERCGRCDVCQAQKVDANAVEKELLSMLNDNPIKLNELSTKLGVKLTEEQLLQVLRELYKKGKIQYADETFRLR